MNLCFGMRRIIGGDDFAFSKKARVEREGSGSEYRERHGNHDGVDARQMTPQMLTAMRRQHNAQIKYDAE